MARPVSLKSLDGATTAGPGTSVSTEGHNVVALFVASGTAPTAIDVHVEVSPDGVRWAAHPELQIVSGDVTQDADSGEYTAYSVATPGLATRYVRARANGLDGATDAYVDLSNNNGRGYQPRER